MMIIRNCMESHKIPWFQTTNQLWNFTCTSHVHQSMDSHVHALLVCFLTAIAPTPLKSHRDPSHVTCLSFFHTWIVSKLTLQKHIYELSIIIPNTTYHIPGTSNQLFFFVLVTCSCNFRWLCQSLLPIQNIWNRDFPWILPPITSTPFRISINMVASVSFLPSGNQTWQLDIPQK